MAASLAGLLADRPVLVCRSRPNRLSLLPIIILAVVLLSAFPLLPAVHGALDNRKETQEVSSKQTTQHAAAIRWSVTVREGGGGHGGGHAAGGHGSGHGRPEPTGHGHPRRSAAPGRELGPSSMAASCALLLIAAAAAALLRF